VHLQVAQRLVDDLPIPAGPFQGSSYLEALLLEYGEQLRVVPQLQHLALRVYLGCPVRQFYLWGWGGHGCHASPA
jgi:hypothetical protein